MLSWSDRFKDLVDVLSSRGVDVDSVVLSLLDQRIETPSWGYANSGTRFGIFKQPGAARNLSERLADAAQVHRHTGIAPAVAIHIPWDRSPNYADIKEQADSLGMKIGAVNPNVFEDQPYKLGSFGNPDIGVRQLALDHMDECIAIMKATGSKTLSLWFGDGTNFPGQDSIVRRKRCFEELLGVVYRRLLTMRGCWSSISRSSQPSITATSAIGEWRRSFVRSWGQRRKYWSTWVIIITARTSSRSSLGCWMKGCWVDFISTIASMPTTT